MKKHLLIVLLLGLLLAVLTACGGGGGGSRAPLAPANPSGNNNQQTPVTFEPAEVTVPQVAESIGEVGGIVADFYGVPVPDLEVYLDSTANVVSSTDEDGNFLASGVSSGDHDISIGVEDIQVASYEVAYDASLPLNLSISPVGLRTASSEGDFGSLKGMVRDRAGIAIPGVHVLVFNNEQFFMFKETNGEGRYNFECLPAGHYGIIGFKRGYRTHIGAVDVTAGDPTIYDFVMEGMPIGRIIGVVRDNEENPLPRSHVFLMYRDHEDGREPPSFHALTNARGEYAFENIPAGAADMLAFHPEYEPDDAVVNVPPEGQIIQNFILHRIAPPPPPPPDFGNLSGRVYNGEHEPIPGAMVVLERPDYRFTAETNDEGCYGFAELPIGLYVFVVSAEGYEPVHGQLAILPGQNIKDFYLGAPPPPNSGNIEGTVIWGNTNEPVPGARLELWIVRDDGTMQKIRETESGECGRFAFLDIPPALGLIKAFKDNASGTAEFHLPPGGNLDITIAIFEQQNDWAGKIVGRTRRVDPNNPDGFIMVPCAEVKLFLGEPDPNKPPIAVTQSNSDAYYEFKNLPPTYDGPDYWVVANKQIENAYYGGMNHTALGENETVELHITMEMLQPPPSGSKIHGYVFLGETDPPVHVACASVKLFHGEPGPNNPPIRETTSGNNGYYAFPELPPSGDVKYFVCASKVIEGFEYSGLVNTFLVENEVKTLNVPIFRLNPPPLTAKIHGHIFIGETDPPVNIVGASVKLFHGEPGPNNPPMRTTTSGDNGYYQFPELPPSGDKQYFIVASKLIEGVEYAGVVQTELAEGQTKIVNVPIFPGQPPDGCAIHGLIKRVNPEDPNLPPLFVPGALVKLYLGDPDGNEPIAITESNAQGQYAFLNLEPTANLPYYIVACKTIEEVLFSGRECTFLEPGQNKELHIMIWPPE